MPSGTRNYITNYATSSTDWYSNVSGWKIETVEDSTARFGRYIKATCTKPGGSVYNASGFYKRFIDIEKHSEFFNQTMTWSMDIKTSKNTKLNIGCEWGNAVSNIDATGNWQRFSKTFEVATSSKGKAWIFYGSNWEVGDIVYIRDVQFEHGPNATTPSQAPEDLGWSTATLVPTQTQRYLWKFEYIYYSDGSVEVAEPVNLSIAGDKGDTGNGIANTVVTYGLSMSDTTEPATWSSSVPTLVKGMYLWTRTVIIYTNGESTTSYQISYIAKDADATAAIDKTKQELLEKLETVRDDSLAAVEEAKQQVTTVADELSTAKQDLQTQASQLQAQANAQSELTKRVSSVEETANGTKTTVSELTKTVAQNGKDITSVTARTKVVEDDLTSTKTTLSQVQTTADGASSKAATLETGLNGIKADLAATTVTADTTKTNLANYQASNDRAVANLQSNLQTANGDISSLKTKVEAVPGQITSAVSAVEGKIPTSVSTRNLILKSNDFANPHKQNGANTTVTSTDDYFVIRSTGYTANAWGGMSWNMSISEVKAGEVFSILMPVYIDSSVTLDGGWSFIIKNHTLNSAAYEYGIPTNKKDQWFNVAITFKAYKDVVFDTYPFFVCLVKNGLVRIKPPMLVRGNLIPSDYQPAFEDTKSDVTKLNTTLTQTANGLEQLSTQVTSQGSTITSHTNSINSLTTGLQAKVSQSEFNTLSGRVTTAENNITAKANELSSKITSVEGKMPSGEMNLVEYGRPVDGYNRYAGAEYATHPFYYNGAFKMYVIRNWDTSEKFLWMNRFKVERNTDYTLFFKGFNDSVIDGMDVWFLKRVNGSTNDFDSAQNLVGGRKLSHTGAEDVSVTFNTGNYDEGYLRFDNNGTTTAGTQAALYFGDVSVKKGKSNNGWSPSLAELASSQDLKNAQSEIKQTTDAIKASVQSLDNNTVKSSSLTINTDGIVMKAGKSTTDVANAIGSYFAVNQNAINLFSDKINVKGSMIVDGAITGDKIKANSVDVSKIVGIDANFIKSKIEYAMIDWLKGKTITAYNDNMTIDLQNGRISFKDGSNAVYRQTPDGIHTGFLHFDAGSLGGIYAAFGATSTREGINSRSSAFAGIRCYRVSKNGASHEAKIDKIEIVGDTVQFGHGYTSDGSIAMGGGFIMDNAAFANESPYSLNRVVKSIESLWRILHDHAKNAGYRFNDPAFINALNNEYNAWHELHNM